MSEFDVQDNEVKDLEEALNWFQNLAIQLIHESSLATEWDQDRLDKLTNNIPIEKRQEVLTHLMKYFDFDWDEIQTEAEEKKSGQA